MPLSLQVNNENVVKVGHRQVVNMIRQGGNHLVLKVVTVTRNLDPDDTARKKGVCPSRCKVGGRGRGEESRILFSSHQGHGVTFKFVSKAMTLNLSYHSTKGGYSWASRQAPTSEHMPLPHWYSRCGG